MSDKSHLTAIIRKNLPKPTQWLLKHGLVTACPRIQVLDYGSGRCGDINPKEWDNYDPHYRPWSCWHKRSYHLIICNYVLCVLPRAKRMPILKDIQNHLKKNGVAYVSVRNDKPKQGWGKSTKGTYQGRVQNLPLALVHECAGFRTYLLTRETKLV